MLKPLNASFALSVCVTTAILNANIADVNIGSALKITNAIAVIKITNRCQARTVKPAGRGEIHRRKPKIKIPILR